MQPPPVNKKIAAKVLLVLAIVGIGFRNEILGGISHLLRAKPEPVLESTAAPSHQPTIQEIGRAVPHSVKEFLDHPDQFVTSRETIQDAVSMLEVLPEPHTAVSQTFWRERLAAERILLRAASENTIDILDYLSSPIASVRGAIAQALTQAPPSQHPEVKRALLDKLSTDYQEMAQGMIGEALLQLHQPEDVITLQRQVGLTRGALAARLLSLAGAAAVQKTYSFEPWKNRFSKPGEWKRRAPHGVAPNFVAQDTNGALFELKEELTRGPVAIMFLTGDHCYMCDTSFVENALKLAGRAHKQNLQIAVILPHGLTRSRAYAKRFVAANTPAISVLADPYAEIAAEYGIARQLVIHGQWGTPRSTFIIQQDQTIHSMYTAVGEFGRPVQLIRSFLSENKKGEQ